MKQSIEVLTGEMKKDGPAEKEILTSLLTTLDFKLPADYLDFIARYNGAEGCVNKGYLGLYRIEELLKVNSDNDVENDAPGYFIFGTDLGGTAFAFHKEDGSVVAFEFVSMLISDKPNWTEKDFESFLKRLAAD